MAKRGADSPPPPITVNHLFPRLARELLALVRSIPPDRWAAPTCYPTWTVHDIATHLAQTAAWRLSLQRDGHRPLGVEGHGDDGARSGGRVQAADFEELAKLIDAANTRWRETLGGLSPRVVVELLASLEPALARYLSRLPRHGRAPVGVAWAGEGVSERWFDTARELTERWHHQQQIREAVGAPGIDRPAYLRPVISTLMRALPYGYRSVRAPVGTTVDVEVRGRSGGRFRLEALAEEGWALFEGSSGRRGGASRGRSARDRAGLRPTGGRRALYREERAADALVSLSEDTAWRFLTRSIPEDRARPLITLSGDRGLAERFLSVVAVMIPAELR